MLKEHAKEVNYHDGDFTPSPRHEFCWIDTVGDQGSRFLTTFFVI